MGSKLATILSMIFAVFVFIFVTDLIAIQLNYSNLENVATSLSQILSTQGGQGFQTFKEELYESRKIEVIMETESFKLGEYVEFEVKKTYTSMVMFSDDITLTVKRSSVIGSYETTV